MSSSSHGSCITIPVKTTKHKEEEEVDADHAVSLKQKVENAVEINSHDDSYTPGQYSHIICPMCKGGQSKERSLWFHKDQNEKLSMWRCSNLECEWAAAHVLEDASPKKDEINKDNILPKPSEETLQLEPIGDELIKYFAGRKITADILQKNAVMQKISNKSVIAFTYRRNGELVSCKFRNSKIKEYWQAKNGEKILYGLDGIKEGNDIVIVEGEIDKLSMEQAGIPNCVSVPNGAPQKMSKKLPTKREDSNLQYLSDCYGHLDKASRIVLATDGDQCGEALAEVLSTVLGRERCWRVTWPKKDESSCYKDANEVLVHLGAEALRHVVETAEKYEILDDPTADEVNKKPSEESLRLEPLGDKFIEYFVGRKISMDILQNNAVMQMIDDKEVKKSRSSSSSSGNMTFVSSPSNISPEEVNVASGVSTANPNVCTASSQTSTAGIGDATFYAFLTSQALLSYEDLAQVDEDDLEEMDLKWQVAMLRMRAKKFWQRTGKKFRVSLEYLDILGEPLEQCPFFYANSIV